MFVNLGINLIGFWIIARLYVEMVLSPWINNVMIEVIRMMMDAHHSALFKIILIA